MNRLSMEINGQTWWLKIGLKGIIYLQSISSQTEEDIFVASIITLQDVSVKTARELFRSVIFTADTHLPLFKQASSFLSLDVRELYVKAVGEMHMTPAQFFTMSPDEIEWAYEGYLRQQELQANLTKLAVVSALAKDPEPISIRGAAEYTIGSSEERDTTFKVLEREL